MKLTEILRGHTRQTVSAIGMDLASAENGLGAKSNCSCEPVDVLVSPNLAAAPTWDQSVQWVGALALLRGALAAATHFLIPQNQPGAQPAIMAFCTNSKFMAITNRSPNPIPLFKSSRCPICDNSHSFGWNQLLP